MSTAPRKNRKNKTRQEAAGGTTIDCLQGRITMYSLQQAITNGGKLQAEKSQTVDKKAGRVERQRDRDSHDSKAARNGNSLPNASLGVSFPSSSTNIKCEWLGSMTVVAPDSSISTSLS